MNTEYVAAPHDRPVGKGMVTVAIPTYNRSDTLARAVRSVLAQEHKRVEILINDDSDRDMSGLTVLRESNLQSKAVYVKNSTRLGLARNYQQGLSNANGEFFLNLDGDDFLEDPAFLSKAVKLLSERQTAAMLIGGQRIVDERRAFSAIQRTTEDAVRIEDGYSYFLKSISDRAAPLPHLATVVRIQLARKIGYYTSDVINTDLHSARRLMLEGDVILISNVCGAWTYGETNTSLAFDAAKHSRNILCLVEPYRCAVASKVLCAEDAKKLSNSLRRGLRKYVRDSYAICLRTSVPIRNIRNFDACLKSMRDPDVPEEIVGVTRYPDICRNLALRLAVGQEKYTRMAFLKAKLRQSMQQVRVPA